MKNTNQMKKNVLTTFLGILSTSLFAQITDTGDKVGIGVENPIHKLDVNGNVKAVNVVSGAYYVDGEIVLDTGSGFLYLGAGDFPNGIYTNKKIRTREDIEPYSNLGSNLGSTSARWGTIYGNNLDLNGKLTSSIPSTNTSGIYATSIFNYSSENASQHGLYLQVESGGGYLIKSSINGGSTKNAFVVNNSGNVGIKTINPLAPLEISQDNDPNLDRALIISEPNNSQKIYLHLANNSSGQYGFFSLGGNTTFRGNGKSSSFDGPLGIGTTNVGTWKLAVNGKIRAKEIKVESGWADFVFNDNYDLPTLTEVENHIKEKGHLKDIPSAKEVEENGIFLGAMNSKLLQKIEELTLYTIEQEKKIKSIEKQNAKIEKLEKENKLLKSLLERVSILEQKLEDTD